MKDNDLRKLCEDSTTVDGFWKDKMVMPMPATVLKLLDRIVKLRRGAWRYGHDELLAADDAAQE
jgi:hypothetical protein